MTTVRFDPTGSAQSWAVPPHVAGTLTGSYLKGDTVATDCTWDGEGCGFLRDADYSVLFVRNTMRTPAVWAATSAGTRPHIVAVDCTFDQSAGGSKLKTTPQSTPTIDLVRCDWTGPQVQVQAQQETIDALLDALGGSDG